MASKKGKKKAPAVIVPPPPELEPEMTDYYDVDPPVSPPMPEEEIVTEYTHQTMPPFDVVVAPTPAREVVDTVTVPREAYEQLVAAAGAAPPPKPNMYVVYRQSPNPGYIGSWEAPDFSLRRMAETASGPGIYEIRAMLGQEIVETTYAEIFLDGKVERKA